MSFSLIDLIDSGFIKQDYSDEGYSISDLIDAGFSIENLRIAEYSITEIIADPSSNFIISDFSSSTFMKSDYGSAGYTILQLRTAGFTSIQLQNSGYNKTDFRANPQYYSDAQLKLDGFTIPDFITAEYSLSDIIAVGYDLSDIKLFGFVKTDYINAGVSIATLKSAGFSTDDFTSALYTTNDLVTSGVYSSNDLITLGYNYTQLIPSGGLVVPGFIFDIDTSVWNSGIALWNGSTVTNRVPIVNTGGSFSDLSYSSVSNDETGLTTVFITWSSYTKNSVVDGLNFNSSGIAVYSQSVNILQFGGMPILNYEGLSTKSPFYGFAGQITAIDVPVIQTTNLSCLFHNASCSQFGAIGSWDVSGVTNTTYMFGNEGASNFNQDIGNWNVSKCTNMSSMFYNAIYFNQDIGSWDVSACTNMASMFYGCSLFNQPIGAWNVSNCTNMASMFYGASVFNQSISAWNVRNVSSMTDMFTNASSFNENIGNWDFTNVGRNSFGAFIANNTGYRNTYTDLLKIAVLIITLSKNPTFINKNISSSYDYFQLFPTNDINTALSLLSTNLVTTNITANIVQPDYTTFKPLGYSTFDLRFVGFSIAQLIQSAGYTLSDLISSGFVKQNYLDSGYTLTNLIDAGFQSDVLVASGFTNSDFVGSINLADLTATTGNKIPYKQLGYSVHDVLTTSGKTLASLVNSDFVKADYLDNIRDYSADNVSLSAMIAAGFSAALLNSIGYTLQELETARVPASELRIIGYSITQILSDGSANGGYIISDLSNSGFLLADYNDASITATQLRSNGFSALQMRNIGYSLSEIVSATVSAGYSSALAFAIDLKAAAFTANELLLYPNIFERDILSSAGYAIGELKLANFGLNDLHIYLGMSYADLKLAGFTAADFKNANIPLATIASLGFTANQLKTLYSATDLKPYFPILDLYNAEFTLDNLFAAGYSVRDLKSVGATAGFMYAKSISITDLSGLGFSANDLRIGNYTAAQLVTIGFTIDQLRAGEYSALNIYDAGFTVSQLIGVQFSIAQMYSTQFPISNFSGSTLTPSELYLNGAGYSPSDLTTIFTIADFKRDNFSISVLLPPVYTFDQLRANGTEYTVSDLKPHIQLSQLDDLRLAGYTLANIITDAGYSMSDAKTYGKFTATNFYDASYNAASLLGISFSLNEMRGGGYTAYDLLILTEPQNYGVTVSSLKSGGYSAQNIIDANALLPDANKISLASMRDPGRYYAYQLYAAGIDPATLKSIGYTATDLKSVVASNRADSAIILHDISFSASELKNVTPTGWFSLTDLYGAGYTIQEFLDATYGLQDLKDAGFSAANLKDYGYTATQLKGVGFLASDLLGLFSADLMKQALYTGSELYTGGYSLQSLYDAGYRANEIPGSVALKSLIDVSYSAIELRNANYTALQLVSVYPDSKNTFFNASILRQAGYTAANLVNAVFSLQNLYDASYSATEVRPYFNGPPGNGSSLKGVGYTINQMLTASYSLYDLKNSGFTASDFYQSDISAYEIRNFISNAGNNIQIFTATQLSDAGYIGPQLYTAGYSIKNLYDASYNPQEVVNAGFNLSELNTSSFVKTNYQTVYITVQNLYDAGFSASNMQTAGYSAANLHTVYTSDLLIGVYSIKDMRDGGYTAIEMRPLVDNANNNITINSLKLGGYTATEMKTAEYTVSQLRPYYKIADLKDAQYTCTELYLGGYSPSILAGAGYIPLDFFIVYNTINATNEETATILITQLKLTGYNSKQLKLGGFSYSQLRDAGFTVTDIKSSDGSVTDATLLAAGFTAEDISKAGLRLYLDNFSSSYTLQAQATLINRDNPILIDASASAVFYISQDAIQSIFKIRLFGDMVDMSTVVIRYFIDMNNWPTNLILNPSNGMLDRPESDGALYNYSADPTKMLVKHDYIRYLALKLFGNANAVDLFNNEEQLIRYLNYIGNLSLQTDISGTLWKYAATQSSSELIPDYYLLDDYNDMRYTTEAFAENSNICRELMYQILNQNRERFNNLVTDEITGLVGLPILAGDNICFNYIIAPAPGQNDLTGVNPIGPRNYRIKLVVDDGTGVNVIPDL